MIRNATMSLSLDLQEQQSAMTKSFMRLAVVVALLAGTSVAADTDIHRCTLEDGTIAFQEMPCPEPVVKPENEAEDEAESRRAPSEPTLPEPVSQNRAECEKTTRDAIDAIDLEMRESSYTKEQGREYLEKLLGLTRRLRACKQL